MAYSTLAILITDVLFLRSGPDLAQSRLLSEAFWQSRLFKRAPCLAVSTGEVPLLYLLASTHPVIQSLAT